jgi:hypothetical protein
MILPGRGRNHTFTVPVGAMKNRGEDAIYTRLADGPARFQPDGEI